MRVVAAWLHDCESVAGGLERPYSGITDTALRVRFSEGLRRLSVFEMLSCAHSGNKDGT